MSLKSANVAGDLPRVSVIVLNYNSLVHLEANLVSLLALEYPLECLEIILADNGSTDGSLEWVADRFPRVRIVRNGANLGYAGGNTAAARTAQGDWLAFLNPDTKVAPDWLLQLIRPLATDGDIGAVASTILDWNGRTIDFADAALNFMGWGCQPGYGNPYRPGAVQDRDLLFACGGAMLVNRHLFLDVGGFDPGFFAYYEDVDLGWRLNLLGHKTRLASGAIVYHRHHGSWEGIHQAKKWLLAERNTLYAVIKNYGDTALGHTLPAALLLLFERVYLELQPAFIPQGMAHGRYDGRYYGRQAWQLLRNGRIRELLTRAVHEIRRRSGSQAPLPSALPAGERRGELAAPVALARLLACCDIRRHWATLWQKRVDVQTARRRADNQIFPLFQWALISNFGDLRFIQAMGVASDRFDLIHLFQDELPDRNRSTTLLERSLVLSGLLLQIADHIFSHSGATEAHFRLKGGLTPDGAISTEGMAAIEDVHRLLWSLPDLPVEALVGWLIEQCRLIQQRWPAAVATEENALQENALQEKGV
jgi:GT2 family glycosyltransferase